MPAVPATRAPAWLLAALLAGALSGGLNVGYRYLLRALGVAFDTGTTDTDTRIVIAALTVVLAPIVEEIFFRGWLQSAIEGELAASRRWLAPILGAFAFAAVRPPLSFAPTMLLGIVCGLLYARSRSVAPCVLAHAAYFAVSLAARYYFSAP
jgi:membrane protease YdiL (CAAX protease family)